MNLSNLPDKLLVIVFLTLVGSAYCQQNYNVNCYANRPEGVDPYQPRSLSEYDIDDIVLYSYVPPPSDLPWTFAPYRKLTVSNEFSGVMSEYVFSDFIEHKFNHPGDYTLRRRTGVIVNPTITASCSVPFSVVGDPQIAPRSPWPADGMPPEAFRNGSFYLSIAVEEGKVFTQPIKIENTGYSDLIVNELLPVIQTDRVNFHPINLEYDNVIPPGGEQLYWYEIEILDFLYLLQNPIIAQSLVLYSNDPRDYENISGINESRGGWRIPVPIVFDYFPNVESIPPSQKYDPPPSAQSSDDVIDYILGRYWLKEDANADGLIDAGDVTEFVIAENSAK